ncbi:MAG: DNA-protecting protein DprA [Pseudomonas fluorescens]|nr:MAG: DNA-protecting protein DprA [Pseudomonas fluorescens]
MIYATTCNAQIELMNLRPRNARKLSTMPLPTSPEMLAKLRIARTPGIGPVSFRKLIRMRENVLDILTDWHSINPKFAALANADSVMRELETLQRHDGILLVYGEKNYPSQLMELPDAPITLSVLGDASSLTKTQVAIVGNRSASASGLTWSKQLASELARANVVLTSGLARGIDTATHEGAIVGGGQTVAVVAGGVDNVYPPENARLREAIIQHGCVVSEQAWGMQPTASLFPRRNRIIAGLSVGVLVSEATRHSGSLITAECALDYNREVWAVPGSPSDPRSSGPNWLLKNGATLIENAQDILNSMPSTPAPYVPKVVQKDLFSDTPEDAIVVDVAPETSAGETLSDTQRVFGLLGSVGTSFDDLVRQTALTEATLSGVLVELELDGHAVRESDGRWKRG